MQKVNGANWNYSILSSLALEVLSVAPEKYFGNEYNMCQAYHSKVLLWRMNVYSWIVWKGGAGQLKIAYVR